VNVTDYPILDVFWTIFIFFGFFLWIWLLITVFSDLFRRKDIGGGGKTLWVIFMLVLPLLGVFIYLITQGHAMGERAAKQAEQSQQEFDSYVKSVAGGSASEIEKAKQLLDSGAITQAEFDTLKANALAKGT
jgi:putative oligomerization/nucleic acid binding protein/phospholipase D-like protein